ncbi:hypothetical protein BpHYR1_002927 [Brachionus plicatilis]|uniref:Uncharacterized protein n=1 Tax=Brachionus plicatilis TaxID=10195 RepID=A0A3M7RBW1_BRAPC|nr:hypothetical protein BpHYR1_002927 [Brachionus plicatilis]
MLNLDLNTMQQMKNMFFDVTNFISIWIDQKKNQLKPLIGEENTLSTTADSLPCWFGTRFCKLSKKIQTNIFFVKISFKLMMNANKRNSVNYTILILKKRIEK